VRDLDGLSFAEERQLVRERRADRQTGGGGIDAFDTTDLWPPVWIPFDLEEDGEDVGGGPDIRNEEVKSSVCAVPMTITGRAVPTSPECSSSSFVRPPTSTDRAGC
jgi:hypothetical protein